MNQHAMLHYSESNVFTPGLFKKHRKEYFDYWSTSVLLFIFLSMHNVAEILLSTNRHQYPSYQPNDLSRNRKAQKDV